MSQKQAGPLSQVLLQPLSCNLVNNSFEAIVHRLLSEGAAFTIGNFLDTF